jgi:hypothetical protein
MIHQQWVVVVLPAYNAANTLEQTYLGVLWTCLRVLLYRCGVKTFPLFSETGRRLLQGS